MAVKAQTFTVSSTPATTGGVAYICLDDANTVTYTANYIFPYDSIVWIFTGGNISNDTGTGPIAVTYNTAGLYSTIARVYENGAVQQSQTYAIDVAQIAPISIFGLADTVCNGDTPFALTGIPVGGTFSGPGVTDNTFDPDAAGLGDHSLTYILTQGACSDTVTQSIHVLPSPNTILLAKGFPTTYAGVLTYSTCDTSNPYFFEFHSITDSNDYVSYTFEYGDGNSISGTTFPTAPTYISYTYGSTGLFTARLTLTGANGCTRTDVINVFIGVSPALGFTRSGTNSFCLPRVDSGYVEVCFNILNTASNDPSTVYIVQYNDGAAADTFYHPAPDSVCHRFYQGSCGFNATASNNSFEATITAINPCGSNAFSNSPIYISEPPSAEIAASERACVNDIVSIFDSTDTGDLVLSNGDCVNGNRLIWDISPNTFNLNGPASDMGFTFGNTDPAFWFGGAQTLDVTFTRSGIYTIRQIAGNSLQCGLDTAFLSICVDTIPTSGFELSDDTVCVGENVTAQFTGELFTLCDTVDLDWRIEPDTGVTYVASSPFDTTRIFSFSIEGFYDIILTASNNCDSVLDTLTVLVQGIPSATFPTDTAICGLTSLDFNQAHIQPSYFTNFSEITYFWDVTPATGWSFTNGTSDTSDYAAIDFTAYGAYQVMVTVTNDCGSFTDTMNVSLTEAPELIALATPFRDTLICPGTDLPFKATTTKGFGPFTYSWGSPSLGTVTNSDSIFLGNITQDTTLFVSVSDSLGCSDSATFTISVAPIPAVDAGNDITICYSDSVQLNAIVSGGIAPLTYLWTPDTGLSANNILNPWRSPLDTSVTYVLTVTDSLGCAYTDTINLGVFPLVNIDAGPDQILCINQGNELLTNGSPAGGTWSGAGISGGNTFDPVMAGLGIHPLIYSFTDGNGCDYTDTILMEVIQQPSLNFVVTPDSGCTDLTITISDSTGVSGHQWYANDSLFSVVRNPSLTVQNTSPDQDSIVAIKLVFTASSNCTDSLTQFITVFPKPNASFSLPSFICAGESIQPTQNSIHKAGATQFEWTVSSGAVSFSDSSLSVPTISFPDFQSGTDSTYTIQLIVTSVDGCIDTVSETIQVRSRPVANFSLPSAACTPLAMNPTNNSTGGSLNYQWTINPLTSVTVANSSSANPTFSFVTPVSDSIVYSITLFVTDSSGCIDSATQTYTTYPQPQLSISKSQNNGCHPFTLTITNNSTSGISGLPALTYAWDLGNGQTSTDTNVTTTYTNTGSQDSTYYIELIAINALGCPDTLVDSIVVHPNPIAQTNFTSFANCAPYIIDSAVVNAILFPDANLAYSWNVYDLSGALIAQYNGPNGMNHTLLVGGDSIYVELVATSPFGCVNDTSTQQLFYTIANPVANFSASPDTACSPMLLSLSDSSTAGVNHQWYVNDSLFSTLQNPQITLFNQSSTSDSTVNIKLVITAGSGCGDSITKQVVIQAKPNAAFTINGSICAGDSLQTMNNSTSSGVLNYVWSASNANITISDSSATQPTFTFPDNQSGTDSIYTIQLIAISSAGCSDTTSQTVTIYSRPVAGFTLPIASCGPLSISPTDTSSGNGIAYSWSISPTTNATLNGATTHSPQIDFTPPAQDSLVYTISLLLTDVNGCVDSFASNYSVYPVPTAAFTASVDSSCHPMLVTFNNQSSSNLSGQDRSSISFAWTFGNGTSSTDSVPLVTFNNTGVIDSVYTVQLIATNSLGCSDTLNDSIVVHPLPRAELNFTATANCAPFLIDTSVVSATLYPNANAIYTWNIYSTNGILLHQNIGADSLSYTISTGGDSVLVELVTSSPFGCTNDTSAQQLFYTIENPVADFVSSPDTGCSPLLLSLIDSSTAGVSHQWYLNGNPFSTNQNPQLNLINLSSTLDSVVIIKLVITAGTGCADSISKHVVIQPKPIAQFSIASSSCANDSLSTVNTSISSGTLSYLWSASSSAISFSNTNDAQPFVIFPDNQSGSDSTYTIQLIVSSAAGCSDTSTENVLIYSRPTADFVLPTSSCGPLTINPTNSSVGNALSYVWSVSPTTDVVLSGDSTANPQLDFIAPLFDSAVYTISLRVIDSNGCADSISYPFSVYPSPIAGFSPSDTSGCGPLNLTFNNTSSSSVSAQDRSTMSFNWTFGNGMISTDSVPNQTFTNAGVIDSVYTVELIVANSLGCSDTLVDSVTVHPNPVAEIDTAGIIDCAPFLLDSNAAKGIVYNQANQDYIWNVYDGTNGNLLFTANGYDSLNYTMFGDDDSVIVELIATSPFGCDNDTATQTFYTLPDSRPGFIIDQLLGCHPHTITITDTSNQGASHQWFINGILSSTIANPVFTLTNTALNIDSTYRITLISTVSGSGCIDSAVQFVTVYPLPQPSFTATEVCIGNITQFTGTAQPIDSIVAWHWDFGDGNIDSVQNTTHTYTSFGTYTISFTATDTRGCAQTYVDSIVVRPNPIADFVANGSCGPDTLCIGQNFTLSDSSSIDVLGGNITQWNWDINNDGTVDYTTQNPQHQFNAPGLYSIKLSVESQYSCPDSIVRQVFVQDSLVPYFTTDTTANCGPLNITVFDSSTGPIDTYLWELYSLDGAGNRTSIYQSNQQNPNPIPTLIPGYERDTTYILDLTIGNCCETVSFQRQFTLKPLPVANFAILPDDTVCISDIVQIQLDGLVNGLPDSLILDYGDGTPVQNLTQSFRIVAGDTVWFWGVQSHSFSNPSLSDTVYTISLRPVTNVEIAPLLPIF